MDKIKELAAIVKYFIVYAGSNSLDFLTAYIENFQHFLFEAAASMRLEVNAYSEQFNNK